MGTRMKSKIYWDKVYGSKQPSEVSWFQEHAKLSLQLILDAHLPRDAAIIDVGGGASTLADDLLANNFTNITVLDISKAGLAAAQRRLGSSAAKVQWLEANILDIQLPENTYSVWHDRAVFHFLISPEDRHTYVSAVLRSVKPGGLVIVATFDENGPSMCSGLPVKRYNSDQLHSEFGEAFELLSHEKETHHTPSGIIQPFTYCLCRKSTKTV